MRLLEMLCLRLSCLFRNAPTFALATSLLAVCCTAPVSADEPTNENDSESVSYYKQIRPIFQARCHGCHQPARRLGDYEMTGFENLLAAGETGDPAIAPGKPEQSNLILQIEVADGHAEMPKKGRPLAQDEFELISRWITEGANDDSPDNAVTRFSAGHPPVYEAPPVITSVDFSPDGKWLAASGYHEVVIYHAADFELVSRLVGLSERIESSVFSPDSKKIAVAGGSPGRRGELQIWDVEKAELLVSKTEGFDTLYGASWSHDGRHVAFGCPDNTVRAIDAESGEQVLFNGAHNDWVFDTVFALKGDHIVSVSRDRSMKLFKFDTERFIDNITSITPGALKGGLQTVDRHPEKDELLVGGADGAPKLYKMYREKDRKIGDDFNLIRAFDALPGRVFDVRFDQDGRRIVACSSKDGAGTIRAFKTDDGSQVANIEVPEGGQFSVDFSVDGKHLVAGGFDGNIRVFEIESGKLQIAFPPVPLNPPTSDQNTNKLQAAAQTADVKNE